MKNVYLNKAGKHTCLDGTVVARGKTVETEEDLVAKFGNKFQLVIPANPVQAAAEAGASGLKVPEGPALPPPVPARAAQAAVVAAPAPANADGGTNTAEAEKNATDAKNVAEGMDDVTAEFPSAVDGLAVGRDKRGWWVFDGDDEAANDKPLKKKEVEPFIKDYLAE